MAEKEDRFKLHSMGELLNSKDREEHPELAYRRGYRDGFIQAVYGAWDCWRLGKNRAHVELFKFWENELYIWLITDRTNRMKWPPTFQIKSVKGKPEGK